MPTIDAQVHSYERDHPGRPWHKVLAGPPEVTGDQMVAAMDAIGVDGAILVSAFTMYRYDASYALEVRKRHPGRFALVKPVDPADRRSPRSSPTGSARLAPSAFACCSCAAALPKMPPIPASIACWRRPRVMSLPLNLHIAGRLDQGIELIRRHPDTQIIVDHLGLVQPHEPPLPAEPWADLPQVLTFAKLPNVAIKITGACTLSREPFPYNGHLGSGLSRHRRLRHRPLPMGHGLDARGEFPHLCPRRRCVPRHGSNSRIATRPN